MNAQIGPDPSLLLVDDDEIFLTRLARAMEKRGFQAETSLTVASALNQIRKKAPAYAVVDLRLEDGNGLDVVEALREKRPDARIIVLTGYGAIATAVAAVKMGATDYLAKPADANDVTSALLSSAELLPPPPENPMSADRVRGNISSGFTNNAIEMSAKPHAGFICIAGHCSGFLPKEARDKYLCILI